MSCLGPGYNPVPPRAWSRVQNVCSTIDENFNSLNFKEELIYSTQIKKGNTI